MKVIDTLLARFDQPDAQHPDGTYKHPVAIKARDTAMAVIVALGLGAGLTHIIPTKTHADTSKDKVEQMSQDGGGY